MRYVPPRSLSHHWVHDNEKDRSSSASSSAPNHSDDGETTGKWNGEATVIWIPQLSEYGLEMGTIYRYLHSRLCRKRSKLIYMKFYAGSRQKKNWSFPVLPLQSRLRKHGHGTFSKALADSGKGSVEYVMWRKSLDIRPAASNYLVLAHSPWGSTRKNYSSYHSSPPLTHCHRDWAGQYCVGGTA